MKPVELSCFVTTLATLFEVGCATAPPPPSWVPVQDAKGTAQLACGLDPADGGKMVVAVLSKTAVKDAMFVVTPVVPPAHDGAKAPVLADSKWGPVYIPPGRPICVHLPLPPTTMNIRSFSVSFSGNSGQHRVSGVALECEPQPVNHWSCEDP